MQVKKINEAEWWDFVERCPTATFFHTPDWYRVWKEYLGWKMEARYFSFKSGNTAMLPLNSSKRWKGLMKQYTSGPMGTYGGIITNAPLSEQEITTLKNYLNRFYSLQIRMNPLNTIMQEAWVTKRDFTQIISLSKGWETIFKQWTKGHSSAAKKGIREGVQIRVADHKDWKTYYNIYQKSRERWGASASNNYNWKLFALIRQIDKNKCKLWLAFINEKIISGCLCFYYNQHVVYWHGGSLDEYFHLKPVHVLQHHIIKEAIQEGFKWYDFNPSGGHEGVVRFKKGFGTEFLASNIYRKQFLSIL